MSKLSDLGDLLVQKTKEKKIKWELIDNDTISTVIGRNGIFLTNKEGENEPYFLIQVKNISGQVVDAERYGYFTSNYDVFEEMMIAAKREYLKADQTIDEIMERLDRL